MVVGGHESAAQVQAVTLYWQAALQRRRQPYRVLSLALHVF